MRFSKHVCRTVNPLPSSMSGRSDSLIGPPVLHERMKMSAVSWIDVCNGSAHALRSSASVETSTGGSSGPSATSVPSLELRPRNPVVSLEVSGRGLGPASLQDSSSPPERRHSWNEAINRTASRQASCVRILTPRTSVAPATGGTCCGHPADRMADTVRIPLAGPGRVTTSSTNDAMRAPTRTRRFRRRKGSSIFTRSLPMVGRETSRGAKHYSPVPRSRTRCHRAHTRADPPQARRTGGSGEATLLCVVAHVGSVTGRSTRRGRMSCTDEGGPTSPRRAGTRRSQAR